MIEEGRNFDYRIAQKTMKLGEKYLMEINHRNIGDLITDVDRHPSIQSIRHYHTDTKLIGMVMLCLTLITKLASVGKGFSDDPEMATLLTQILLIKYPHMTLADLKYVIIQNSGTKLFDRIDANTIIEWVDDHMEKRFQYSEMHNRLKHERRKAKQKQEKHIPMPDFIKQAMDKADKKLAREKAKEKRTAPRYFRDLRHYVEYAEVDIEDVKREIEDQVQADWQENEEKYTEAGIEEQSVRAITTHKYLLNKSKEINNGRGI